MFSNDIYVAPVWAKERWWLDIGHKSSTNHFRPRRT